MADPLKTVLENVDRELNPEPAPEVARFAPQKLRANTLQGMLDGYRKLRDDLDAQNRMVEQYISAQKSSLG